MKKLFIFLIIMTLSLLQANTDIKLNTQISIADGTIITINGDLQNSGSIDIGEGSSIAIEGDFTNQGLYINNGGKLLFFGSTNSYLNNVTGSQFGYLKVDKDSTSLILNSNLYLSELLEIVNGDLDTRIYTLTMGATAFIKAEPTSIIGNLQGQSIYVGTSPFVNTILGISLTSGVDIGNLSILCFQKAVSMEGFNGILRRWRLSSDNAPLGRNLIFSWSSPEDNGVNVSNLNAYKEVTGNWISQGVSSIDNGDPRSLTINNITGFSDWTVAEQGIDVTPSTIAFNTTKVGFSSINEITITNDETSAMNGTFSISPGFSIDEQTREADFLSENSNSRRTDDNQKIISLSNFQNPSNSRIDDSLNNFDSEQNVSAKIIKEKDCLSTINYSDKIERDTNFTIPANSSKIFNINFSPSENIDYLGALLITQTSPVARSASILLSGTGIMPAAIALSESTINKNLGENEISSQPIQVTNSGETNLVYAANIIYPASSREVAIAAPFAELRSTGTCTYEEFIDESKALVQGGSITPKQHAWMKFDISAIPDNATITAIDFHGFVENYNYPWWSITPLTADPQSALVLDLYNDIEAEATTGYYNYFTTDTNDSGWKTYTLGGDSNIDLQNALSQNWFAFGMPSRDDSDTYYTNFSGWNEINSPYLEISYTLEESQTWLTINSTTSIDGLLADGEISTHSLGFDSQDLITGEYSGIVRFSSNDLSNPTIDLPVTLNVAIPQIQVSDSSISFDPTIVEYSHSHLIKLTNSRDVTIEGNISIDSAFSIEIADEREIQNFAVQKKITKNAIDKFSKNQRFERDVSYSLPANSSIYYNVIFTPISNIGYSGYLTISETGTGNDPTIVSLSGAGVSPATIELSVVSIDEELDENESTSQPIQVTNNGETDLVYAATVIYPATSREQIIAIPFTSDKSTGTCTSTEFVNNSKVLVKGGISELKQHGWMKFDISAIPDEATITSINFNGYVDDYQYPYWSITPLTVDPQTADIATLFNDIEEEADSGYYNYLQTNSNSSSWTAYTLGGNANIDLQNALTQDWFAFGMPTRDGFASYLINFSGWNEIYTPYLEISYTLEETQAWLSIDSTASLENLLIPNDISTHSIGLDSEGLPTGDYSGIVRFTSNDLENPTIDIPVSLYVTIPQIEVSSNNISFEDTPVNFTHYQELEITNNRNTEVSGTFSVNSIFSITIIESRNNGFKTEADSNMRNSSQNVINEVYERDESYLIPANCSKVFNISFTPLENILYSENLTITETGTGNEPTIVALMGTGIELPIPQNIAIAINNLNVIIEWDIVQPANSYKIYGSQNPDNNYLDITELGTVVVIEDRVQWTCLIGDYKFFYVTSSTE